MKVRVAFLLLVVCFLLQVFLPKLESLNVWGKQTTVSSFHFYKSNYYDIIIEEAEEDEIEVINSILAASFFVLFIGLLLAKDDFSSFISLKTILSSESILYRICVLRV